MNTVFDFVYAAAPWISAGLLVAIIVVRRAVKENNGKKKYADYGTEGMCVGMCLGTAIGTAIGGNTELGVSLGMLVGLAIGICITKKADDTDS